MEILQRVACDLGDELEQGKLQLRQSAERTRTVLSLTRLFIAFGDKNRNLLLSFLKEEHAITVSESEFKEKMSLLIERFPRPKLPISLLPWNIFFSSCHE